METGPSHTANKKQKLGDIIDRQTVEENVIQDGAASYPYLFLIITSSGIATLGLLLNSAAVIIGAMLIAPLMNPIVLFGFAIAKTDVKLGVRGGQALLLGVIGGLLVSVGIVKLSPIISPTPEILARTNPNLFDLGVAIFSGLVAGYAVVHKKIGTIGGVAIATALMPPLAASGYGLAVGELVIFKGAFYLFLTNLIAIAFSVAFMAAWYGFGNLHTPQGLLGKTFFAGVILAVLSIPLFNTLNESVRATVLSKQVQQILRNELKLEERGLANLRIKNRENNGVKIYAQIFTTKYDKDAELKARNALAKIISGDIEIKIDQVMIGHAEPIDMVNVPVDRLSRIEAENESVKRMRSMINAPLVMSDIDTNRRTAKFLTAPSYPGDIAAIHEIEEQLRREFPDWESVILPPIQQLPEIEFEEGSSTIPDDALPVVQHLAWAIKRWDLPRVTVVGYASLSEQRKYKNKLALNRAQNVAELLQQAGVEAYALADAPLSDQKAKELEYGRAPFRRVIISFATTPAALDNR